MDAVLRLESVARSFGGPPVLRGLSLAVAPGDRVAVVGPNGSGKTTLFRIAAGLLRPGRGSVRLFGEDPYAHRAVRRRVGAAGHEPWLYDGLTARENLALHARIRGLDGTPVDAMLQALGLDGDRRAGTLSRGMRQRLSLARALLHRPDLLILDEPFSHLDARGREILERLLSDHPGALLLTAGDLRQAGPARRVVRLEGGGLVEGP